MAARQQGEDFPARRPKRRTGSAENPIARNFDHAVELQERVFWAHHFRRCGPNEQDPAAQPFLDELAQQWIGRTGEAEIDDLRVRIERRSQRPRQRIRIATRRVLIVPQLPTGLENGQTGAGRDPAPGTQQLFGALVQAWIDTGAQCP